MGVDPVFLLNQGQKKFEAINSTYLYYLCIRLHSSILSEPSLKYQNTSLVSGTICHQLPVQSKVLWFGYSRIHLADDQKVSPHSSVSITLIYSAIFFDVIVLALC